MAALFRPGELNGVGKAVLWAFRALCLIWAVLIGALIVLQHSGGVFGLVTTLSGCAAIMFLIYRLQVILVRDIARGLAKRAAVKPEIRPGDSE